MLREWAEILLKLAETAWAPLVLVAHAFLESFILPIAHDFFLVVVSLARPKMSLVYALMSTMASTLGNAVGYSIGRMGGKALLEKRVKHRVIDQSKQLLNRYDIWATAIACFTPFPDKVYSLFAGALHLNFRTFITVIFFARAARFYLIAFAIFFGGEPAKKFLLEHLGTILLSMLGLMILSSLTWKIVLKRLTGPSISEETDSQNIREKTA